MTDIGGLLERVRNFDGTDETLEGDVFSALIGVDAPDAAVWFGGGRSILMSVDRALALVERKLPGWKYGLHSHNRKPRLMRAYVVQSSPFRPMPFEGESESPALALLAALLSALSSGDAS